MRAHAPVVVMRPDRADEPRAAARPAPVEEHLASLTSPYSFEADQYRVLRQFVQTAWPAAASRMLAVTSPAAGDGKTTTAINLAVTLAQSPSARVLLVDTDLRRPLVAAHLGLDAEGPGLAEAALDPEADLRQVVRPTPFNLAVLPAGRPPENAYEVLDSPRVGRLLEQARELYDCVVLDTPPVLVVPDCKLMSQWVDGYLLVVAAHRTPRRLLGEALSALDEEKVLGIVFNGDDRPLSGYGRYYGKYYQPQKEARNGWWPWASRGKARPQPWR